MAPKRQPTIGVYIFRPFQEPSPFPSLPLSPPERGRGHPVDAARGSQEAQVWAFAVTTHGRRGALRVYRLHRGSR